MLRQLIHVRLLFLTSLCLMAVVMVNSCQQAGESVDTESLERSLLDSISCGDREQVSFLLREGVRHELRDASKKGLVELAIEEGDLQMISCLLTAGVSPNEIAHDGSPVMFTAVRRGDVGIVRMLLKAGADKEAVGRGGQTALYVAAASGRPGCLAELLKAGAKIEALDDRGVTPLWYTLKTAGGFNMASEACLKLLLEAGADASASASASENRSLLCEAVKRGFKSDITALLHHGADVNAGGEEGGLTALGIAAEQGDAEITKMLLSRGADGGRLLVQAVADRDMGRVELLLDAGLSVDAWSGEKGDSVIAYSIRAEDLQMTEVFLKHGANAEAKGLEGQSPLHMAIALNNPWLVRALLKAGHDPNLEFATPVSDEFLKLTRKKLMRWFLKNESQLTPLMMAVNNGNLEMIRDLLGHGAKKNKRSARYRFYPLNFATRRADVKAMQTVLGKDPEREKLYGVVDLSRQRVDIFNAKGKTIFSSRVSTGKAGSETPIGEYVITDKHRSHESTIYGSSMPFFQRFSSSAIGFHSGVCPGYPASHGCIRIPYGAAKRLFSVTPIGTRIVIQK